MNTTDYATYVMHYSKKNQVGIEYNLNHIRIDWVMTTSYKSFKKMMDELIKQAIQLRYNKLFFADSLTDETLKMFKMYGFKEKDVCGDCYNHYLYYFIDEGGCG